MTKTSKEKSVQGSTIALNRKAKHDFFIEQRFEAGICLEGWEVKSLRAGRLQLNESYALLKQEEVWLFGAHISPLATASTHISTDPTRTRKLLLHEAEIKKLIGAIDQKGYTLIPLALYWKGNKIKCEIALAKGKKLFDKRQTEKDRSWDRQKERLFKSH
jgi:SsrA-binding protein